MNELAGQARKEWLNNRMEWGWMKDQSAGWMNEGRLTKIIKLEENIPGADGCCCIQLAESIIN